MPTNDDAAKPDPAKPAGATVTATVVPPGAKVVRRPVIVNLGGEDRKRIKKLKRGSGPLVDEVNSAVDQVADELGQDVAGQGLVPVVVLYREKRRKRRGGPQGMCPFCCV